MAYQGRRVPLANRLHRDNFGDIYIIIITNIIQVDEDETVKIQVDEDKTVKIQVDEDEKVKIKPKKKKNVSKKE